MAGGHRAGEGDEIDAVGLHELERLAVAEMQILEQALGQPGRLEGGGEALGAQRRLRRVLEQHRVAGHQRRHHRVHRGQVRIVPGRDDEDHAQRLAAHEAVKPLLGPGVDIGEHGGRDVYHVAGPLLEAADLSGRMGYRTSHLPADLGGDLAAVGYERVHGASEQRLTLADRHALPSLLRGPGS